MDIESLNVANIEAFREFARKFSKRLGDREVILLEGPLGAGKTLFVKSVLGEIDEACSPTFVVHNRYQAGTRSVDHIDLYRLESDEDLESTGFWDLFSQPKAWIFIEWADRLVHDLLPKAWGITRVKIEMGASETSRTITCQRLC